MRLTLRLTRYILVLTWMVSGFSAWAQELNFQLSVSLTPEMTTGAISGKSSDPMDLLRNSRSTYKPEISLLMEVFPFLGIETGIYQKDRGLGITMPVQDAFGNTISYSNLSSHTVYLGLPLKVNLKWEDIYLSVGPSLEILTDIAAYQNGQAITPSQIPSRNMEIVLNCQIGWEAQFTRSVRGFVGINMDAQWLRALQPDEYRYASIGLATGLRFGFSGK